MGSLSQDPTFAMHNAIQSHVDNAMRAHPAVQKPRSNWALAIKLDDELTVTLHSDEDDAYDTLRATFAHLLDAETANEHMIDALETQYSMTADGDNYFMATIEECEVK